MTPDEALSAGRKQSPRSVVIIAEAANGALNLSTGPDMNLEHINFLLDQAKLYLLNRTLTIDHSAAQDAALRRPVAELARVIGLGKVF